MRNQYMAKVLVHNKVVTEEQVKAHWGEITDSMDIGQVLVHAGILKESMYAKVLAFVENLEAKNAKPASDVKPAGAPATPASHPASAPAAAPVTAPAPAPVQAAAPAPQPAEEPAIKIEGNSSLYG